ncbi:MAG: glycoside hydrolase family 3 C-terminal domain-containing protein [Clostridiales bacterium]|nr:glycoside hydrolase family 3 C-terminal domain-containing protein [Clostridiales bacterium]
MESNDFIEKLIAEMTLEEKAAQMLQVPVSVVGMDEAREWARKGVGSFLNVIGDDMREIQRVVCEESRLKIPAVFGIDAVHGHCLNRRATIFPSQLAMAASFDRELVEKIGRVTATEVATEGIQWTFSPILCLARDPRWGRTNETFGEDKYLAGELGVAIIKGYQGEDLKDGSSVLACAKHFIGYGEATGARDSYDTEITFRKIRDEFLPPFRKAVDAGCATIMTAYGSIDGTPLTINDKALRGLLRDELGFDGFLITDWDTVNSLIRRQRVCDNHGDASRLAAAAGNDMIMCSTEFYDAIVQQVREGKLQESVLDEAVRHILTIKLRQGLWEKPLKTGIPGSIGCDAHHEVALKAARESVVLLSNNGVLPVRNDRKIRKIAVIGPNADDIRAQYGDWTYFTHPVPGRETEPERPYVTLLEGVKEQLQDTDIKVVYSYGCSVNRRFYYKGNYPDTGAFMEQVYADNDHDAEFYKEMPYVNEAAAVARESDLVILALGDNYTQAGEYTDRADLGLSGMQGALLRVLSTLHVPIVTVLISSKPLAIPDVVKKSDAVICAFNGGMYSGRAVAEAIFGKLNPRGRLPISFPVMTGQVPVYYNQLPGWHEGRYVDCPAEPLFAFGEGLSYTWYEYSGLKFDKETKTVSVDVKNTGDMDGVEVVQVYVNDVVSSVMTAVKNLAAFCTVDLKAGEQKTVELKLDDEAFSIIRPDETSVIEPGEFIIMAGHSSKDEDQIKISVEF